MQGKGVGLGSDVRNTDVWGTGVVIFIECGLGSEVELGGGHSLDQRQETGCVRVVWFASEFVFFFWAGGSVWLFLS